MDFAHLYTGQSRPGMHLRHAVTCNRFFQRLDRAGRERLLRYCARPPFALQRLRELDCEHVIYDPPNNPLIPQNPQ